MCKFLGPLFESTGMQHSAPFPTKIGIFWFYGEGRGRSKFLGISRESNTASVINGSRSLNLDHDEGWSLLQQLNPEIRDFDSQYFPRGRLIWDQSNEHWRLLVDQKLLRGAFVTTVILEWNVPRYRLIVRSERQYQSKARIGLPAL
jgi:hypothetical protein